MEIANYREFLQLVKTRPEPQRLLFVFTDAQLPDDASEHEREQFREREGAALTPILCGDRLATEMEGFSSLCREVEVTGRQWEVLFVSSITRGDGAMPTVADVEQFMKVMLEAIKQGKVSRFAAFNRDGELLRISRPGTPSVDDAAAPSPFNGIDS